MKLPALPPIHPRLQKVLQYFGLWMVLSVFILDLYTKQWGLAIRDASAFILGACFGISFQLRGFQEKFTWLRSEFNKLRAEAEAAQIMVVQVDVVDERRRKPSNPKDTSWESRN
jgi:hypothetical protein